MSQTIKNAEEIVEKYASRTNPARVENMKKLGLGIVVDKVEGAKIFDTEGKTYIDCFCDGGQFVLGHRRPEMVEALRSALKELDLGNFPMISAQKAALAKLIAEITPGELKVTVFGVSRGESNDFAMKLARGFTGRKDIVCLEGGHHGETGFALSASDDPEKEKLFGPLIPHIKRVPVDPDAIAKSASDRTAAIIIEPVQSDAGAVIPDRKILVEARKACDRSGAVLIFDEGQLAFGRTGRLFACEHSGVVPDILTFSKGLGGTVYPISATVFTSKLNRFMLTHALIHLSTFGGADVGCMVAMACIGLITKDKLWENAEKMGARLADGLNDATTEGSGKLKQVRGIGLVQAVEAQDEETAAAFTKNLAANGVIALQAPGCKKVVRFTPPIDINEEETDTIISAAKAAAKAL